MHHGAVILNCISDIPVGMRRSDPSAVAGEFTGPSVSNLQEAHGSVRLCKKGGTDDET